MLIQLFGPVLYLAHVYGSFFGPKHLLTLTSLLPVLPLVAALNVDTSFCIWLQRPSNAVGSSSIFFGLTSKCFIYQPLTPFFQPSDQHHLFCPFNLEHNKALTKQEGPRRAMAANGLLSHEITNKYVSLCTILAK